MCSCLPPLMLCCCLHIAATSASDVAAFAASAADSDWTSRSGMLVLFADTCAALWY